MHGKVPNNLCLPFIDPPGSIVTIKILAWIVITTQTVTSFTIGILHTILVINLQKSEKVPKNLQQLMILDNIELIVQLLVITTPNIVCWFPVNCIYIAAVCLTAYQIDLLVWSIVIGVPLNSIINPSVFSQFQLRSTLSLNVRPQIFYENPVVLKSFQILIIFFIVYMTI